MVAEMAPCSITNSVVPLTSSSAVWRSGVWWQSVTDRIHVKLADTPKPLDTQTAAFNNRFKGLSADICVKTQTGANAGPE